MKKIGIDARLYSQTGVGTYLQNLLYYLDKNNPEKEIYYIYLTQKDSESIKFKSKNLLKRTADYPWHGLSEQIGFLIQLYRDNLDLMHFTYFSYPVLYTKKFVATVHDTTPLVFKTGKASTKNPLVYNIKHLFFSIVLRRQVFGAAKIITPTKTVKKQLIGLYGERISGKINPIYEGISYQMEKTGIKKTMGKQTDRPFIYVGNFYPHKNLEKLVRAFSKIRRPYKLILLGPNDFFKNRLLKLVNELGQQDRIIFVNNPTIAGLINSYQNALALIHPSLSEGFGLPLIEAAHFDCPIIASNIEVFKELLGNGYVSFNPADAGDIENKINFFLEKRPVFDYKNIRKNFSFEKMTAETIKIYNKIIYDIR